MGDLLPNELGNLDLTTSAQQHLDVSVPISVDSIVQRAFERLVALPLEQKIEMLESLLDEIRKIQTPPTLPQLVEQARQQIARGEWEEGGFGNE